MDSDLVVRAQHGDREAFTALVDTLGGRLHAAAYGILRDREQAQDATQQALLWAWRNIAQVRDPEKFGGWAYRLLVRACHQEAKHAGKWLPVIDDLPGREPITPDATLTVADRDQIDRAFRHLSVDQRAVVVLVYYADLRQVDVAAALGVPVGTVNSRLYRAMRIMRAALEADTRDALPHPGPSIAHRVRK